MAKDELAPLPIPKRGDPDFSNIEKATSLVECVNACVELKVIPETAGKVHKSKAGLAIEIFAPGSNSSTGSTLTIIATVYDEDTDTITSNKLTISATDGGAYDGG